MILVTGATGLVGGHLLWHLLQQNERIAATKRSGSNTGSLKKIFSCYTNNAEAYLMRIDWKIADITDYDSTEQALEGIDIVFHCAAVVSLSAGDDNMISTNVNGTRNIIRAAQKNKIKQFCYVSSIAACGSSQNGCLVDEESPVYHIEKRQAYAKSKYYSEQLVLKAISEGLNAVIVNPGVILGYSGTNGGSAALFASVRKGLPFYTNGGSGYIDVEDVVKIMIQLIDNQIAGGKYILIAENCSNREIINQIASGYNKPKPFIKIAYPVMYLMGFIGEIAGKIFHFQPVLTRSMAKSATSRSWYSNAKIIKTLNYKFKPIKQSISEICRY